MLICADPACGGAVDDDGYCVTCWHRAEPRATAAGPAPHPATTALAPGEAVGRNPGEATSSGPIPPLLDDPEIPESRRFCTSCRAPVGRGEDGRPGHAEGVCNCGRPFSFTPKLQPGELVGGQYEVSGCLAHGGLGWVYLAVDRKVESRRVVLKGLLDTDDPDAMSAALAERRFLAEVEHPNIVRIHNFVEHDGDGYIVMEYVAGTSLQQLLSDRRAANRGRPDPLPLAEAIGDVLQILPALGHLHQLGLLYCDLKPSNIIRGPKATKLIDLGGVYRLGDPDSAVYGTIGYQAPEVGWSGPTVASDLYTVGRTLAVLTTDFAGYQTTGRHSLPDARSTPVFVRFDPYLRFLERATAPEPAARFSSAEEMEDQLRGVLREVTSVETGRPAPGTSIHFTGNLRGSGDDRTWRTLPALLVKSEDPAAGFLATVNAIDPAQLIGTLRAAPERTVEVDLRIVRELLEVDQVADAVATLDSLGLDGPDAWRDRWYRGLAALASDEPAAALSHFEHVYRMLPGEPAPKLAMARALETLHRPEQAGAWYGTVSGCDPSFTSAAFGLARCRRTTADRNGAVAAYDRVPPTSSVYVDAQVAKATTLLDPGPGTGAPNIVGAARAVEVLDLDAERRAALRVQVLETGLAAVRAGLALEPDGATAFGCLLTERELRSGLESAYRALARYARDEDDRVAIVDRANEVRPWSLR
jgi:serine/threonine-protein kinase PknG